MRCVEGLWNAFVSDRCRQFSKVHGPFWINFEALIAHQVDEAGQIYVIYLRGNTARPLVILESQRDLIRVIASEQGFLQSNLASRAAVQDILRKFVEGLEYVHLHSLANSVLPLNVR